MARKKDPKSKENITKTAFILFLEKGYKEVTIKNIMDETGLSKGAIYHHFTSKEEIYEATLQEYYFKILNNEIIEIITGDFKKDIIALYEFTAEVFSNIEHLSEKGLAFPIRNFFSFQLESETNEGVRHQILETVEQYRKSVQQLVKQAIDTKQIRSDLDVEAVAYQIIGMMEGLALHHSTVKGDIKNILLIKYKYVFDNYFKLICLENS